MSFALIAARNTIWKTLSVEAVSYYLTVLGFFGLPFAKSLGYLLLVGPLLFLSTREGRARTLQVLQHPLGQINLIIIVLLIMSGILSLMIYPSSPETYRDFYHYLPALLLMPTLMALYTEPHHRELALLALLPGCMIAMLYKSLMHFNFIPFSEAGGLHRISLSIIVAFSTMVLLHKTLESSRTRFVYAALTVVFILFLFTVNRERTGMLAFLVCGLTFCFYALSWRKIIIVLMSTVLVLLSFYGISAKFNLRVNRMIHESRQVMNYQFFGANSDSFEVKSTSIGLRYTAVMNSISLIEIRPWFGHGLGSTRSAYETVNDPIYQQLSIRYKDPDNLYVMYLVEFGVVGVALLFLWWGFMWRQSAFCSHSEKVLLRYLLITFGVSSVFFSTLYVDTSWLMFVGCSSILLAGSLPRPLLQSPRDGFY